MTEYKKHEKPTYDELEKYFKEAIEEAEYIIERLTVLKRKWLTQLHGTTWDHLDDKQPEGDSDLDNCDWDDEERAEREGETWAETQESHIISNGVVTERVCWSEY